MLVNLFDQKGLGEIHEKIIAEHGHGRLVARMASPRAGLPSANLTMVPSSTRSTKLEPLADMRRIGLQKDRDTTVSVV